MAKQIAAVFSGQKNISQYNGNPNQILSLDIQQEDIGAAVMNPKYGTDPKALLELY
jgi:hypothetical protein